MATAMQAVTINLPPGMGRTASYAWNGMRCHLFAAGGSHPDMVYCWDMMHEMCSSMVGGSAQNVLWQSGGVHEVRSGKVVGWAVHGMCSSRVGGAA